SSRRRHTRWPRDWSSDVCSSDLFLTQASLDFLRMRVGPLMRHVPDVDVAEATFTSKVERLKYQMLARKVEPSLLESISEDVALRSEERRVGKECESGWWGWELRK